MLNQRLSELSANTAADAVTGQLNGGTLCLFEGKQPEPNDPVEVSRALAVLKFAIVAFGLAENGMAIANPIMPDESAKRTGKARWFRAFTSLGEAVFDGSVGEADSNLNLDSVDIQVMARVSVSRLTYVQEAN